MFQIYYHDGAGDQGGDGACRGRLFPVMSHDIWEEGTGCSKCEAEHQDGYNALCVKESDEHGGQAHQTHDDFCNLHDGLAGCIRLQHCLIDVIGKDGACA